MAVPHRVYEIQGITTEVPDGNGGVTRVAPSNPAWIWRSLSDHRKSKLALRMAGIGLTVPKIADERLYILATICDEPVTRSDGTTGPRFEFNGMIGSKRDLIPLFGMIATSSAIAESRAP